MLFFAIVAAPLEIINTLAFIRPVKSLDEREIIVFPTLSGPRELQGATAYVSLGWVKHSVIYTSCEAHYVPWS